MSDQKEFRHRLWGFLYFWDDTVDIQSWVARHPELRAEFGDDLYQAVVSVPNRNTPAEEAVRERLKMWALSSPFAGCPCVTWADRQEVGLGSLTATLDEDWFTVLKKRNPWLHLLSCNRCSQCWYLAIDAVNDLYYFVRLSEAKIDAILKDDRWPADFDTIETVWPDPEYP